MYCPKCAVENSEDLDFCRSCGEDLTVVLQAMKKHLPITLISKFDTIFEKKNERFRQKAILSTIWGIFLFILFFTLDLGFSVFSPIGLLILFATSIYTFATCSFYFLAYRRSLELQANSKRFCDETSKFNEIVDSEQDAVFCPNCGLKNLGEVSFCRDCGTNLDFQILPRGLERYLPDFVIKKLDKAILKNDKAEIKPHYKSYKTLFVFSFVILLLGIIQIVKGDWSNATFYFLVCLSTLAVQSWNLVAYNRTLEKELKTNNFNTNESNFSFKDFQTKQLSPQDAFSSIQSSMITESTTKSLVNKLELDENRTTQNLSKQNK
jgi:hypothetical protein